MEEYETLVNGSDQHHEVDYITKTPIKTFAATHPLLLNSNKSQVKIDLAHNNASWQLWDEERNMTIKTYSSEEMEINREDGGIRQTGNIPSWLVVRTLTRLFRICVCMYILYSIENCGR